MRAVARDYDTSNIQVIENNPEKQTLSSETPKHDGPQVKVFKKESPAADQSKTEPVTET